MGGVEGQRGHVALDFVASLEAEMLVNLLIHLCVSERSHKWDLELS